MWLAFVVVLVPLGFVLFTVIAKGARRSQLAVPDQRHHPAERPARSASAAWAPAVIGTLEITGFAALIAIPLGVLGAVYINEYGGKGSLARLIAFMADVMTGVPSIVMGLFIYTIWVLHFGYSGLAGSFALACLMLPIVIRSSYEMLRLVPDSLRRGQLRPRRHQVPGHADRGAARRGRRHRQRRAARRRPRGGRDGAAAVHHPHGGVRRTRNLFSGADTALSTQIFANAQSPYVGAEARAWGAALTLIAIAFILMIAARIVTARFTRYSR